MKIFKNPPLKKVFTELFQKKSAVPTAKLGRYAPTGKLGHSGIKIVTVYPDGVELIKVEHTFLKTPKNLSARKFFAELFFKKATKP